MSSSLNIHWSKASGKTFFWCGEVRWKMEGEYSFSHTSLLTNHSSPLTSHFLSPVLRDELFIYQAYALNRFSL